jgi:hypothetical protein
VNAGRQRAARADAGRVGDLGDHGVPGAVGQHEVEVGVGLQLVLGERGLHAIHRRFGRLGPLLDGRLDGVSNDVNDAIMLLLVDCRVILPATMPILTAHRSTPQLRRWEPQRVTRSSETCM